MPPLPDFIAQRLERDAAELGLRWQAQAPSFAPRAAERSALPAGEG